jgi:hypothetical protein
MTFEEFKDMPDPPGHHYELHHEELIKLAYPKFPHIEAQHRLHRLLEDAAVPGDIVRQQVDVSTPDGHTITYKSGQSIPLLFAAGRSLPVDSIFA